VSEAERRAAFREVAPGVYVLRYPVLDVNTTLVVGYGGALVVDTLSGNGQGRELLEAVRAVTPAPLTIVNTHHHFDHWFGNWAVAREQGAAVWAHHEAAAIIAREAEKLRAEAAASFPELTEELLGATLLAPNRTVHHESTVDIGGRRVVLRHLGRGHSPSDLVVEVPDADVVLAGDLVEEGAPPAFGDSYPLEWAETLAELLSRSSPSTVVVPGHGAVVDREFVRGQHEELTALSWLIRDGHADGAPAETVAAKSSFDAETALVAVRRGYLELGRGL